MSFQAKEPMKHEPVRNKQIRPQIMTYLHLLRQHFLACTCPCRQAVQPGLFRAQLGHLQRGQLARKPHQGRQQDVRDELEVFSYRGPSG